MAQLLDQCPEVIHNIFQYLDPTDLANLSRSCQRFNHFIQNDDLLWKTQYLSLFDDPSPDTLGQDTTWKSRLINLVILRKLLESENTDVKRETLDQVATEAINLMLHSTSDTTSNSEFLTNHFSSESNVSAYLCRSSLFENSRFDTDVPAKTEALRQLSARLHVFYGLEVEPPTDSICYQGVRQVHPFARSRVYDLRRYNNMNFWGPFMDDGSERVDWEKVQAIMIVLSYNLRMYTERRTNVPNSNSGGQLWNRPFHGLAPNSYVSHPLSGPIAGPSNPDLAAQDPYGVTGTWMRIVCFLDYNDLYAFNFESGTISQDQEREPISTREAFRLIRLQLRVTDIEQPGEKDAQNMPIVHFKGSSKSTFMSWDPNANSTIRGTVRTTASGAIRWTSFSIFHGEERWRSEGVQIGGIRSSRGILGNWFDTNYDLHGPAGPTAFWKVSDDIVEEKRHVGFTPWHEIASLIVEAQ